MGSKNDFSKIDRKSVWEGPWGPRVRGKCPKTVFGGPWGGPIVHRGTSGYPMHNPKNRKMGLKWSILGSERTGKGGDGPGRDPDPVWGPRGA